MTVVTLTPPNAVFQNVEAEQQVLGSLIMADKLVPIVMQHGGVSLFATKVHAKIYQAIEVRHQAGELVSPITLKAAFEGLEDLEPVGGPAYLARLAGSAIYITVPALTSMANMLAEYARKRAIHSAASETLAELARGDMPASDIANRLEGALVAHSFTVATDQPTSMLAAVNEAVTLANQAYRGETSAAVSFGIPPLDAIIPGLQPGELTLLGGRPAMGKSAVALTMALNAARAGRGVAIASLEMTPAAMAHRALSEATANAGRAVPYQAMRRGDMSEEEMRAVVEVAQDVAQLPITFLSRSYSDVDALVGGVRQITRATDNLRLLIVDYAQLLRAKGRDRYQQVTAISLALKGMAMSLNIPVLALSQLSRGIESREDKRPVLSDLRESGQLEQDADNVLFCFRPEYYLQQEQPDSSDLDDLADWELAMNKARGRLEIIVAKQRMGSTGTARCMCALSTNSVWGE
ncbi:replicative DNA helicase [Paracoccus rhizosphaerae]|uniref:DNA 5'-3' helicase n=1 Tax=Paracoccus rhizosphaerae TaxID=1133347 RepID=A0ABV6CMG4_9RHOB|nr:DnaB-like helicase C-terminal domain-containing protein [Paracoccus rhizosphaerae]